MAFGQDMLVTGKKRRALLWCRKQLVWIPCDRIGPEKSKFFIIMAPLLIKTSLVWAVLV